MPDKIEITSKGIKSQLKRLKFTESQFFRAIAEYISNGFDAKATVVNVNYEFGGEGNLRKLEISDNGSGINHHELTTNFKLIFDSKKLQNGEINKHSSKIRGRNGVGRLTFFTFAHTAKWITTYQDKGENFTYPIQILAKNLELYSGAEEKPTKTSNPTGTTVYFSDFKRPAKSKTATYSPETEMLNYLKKEFAWYLELMKSFNYILTINGKPLDYSDLVQERDEVTIKNEKTGVDFKILFLRWSCQLHDQYSKFYYLNNDYDEKYKDNTTLNLQGDKFYHSVFIRSDYFNDFNFESAEKPDQKTLVDKNRSDDNFKFLQAELLRYLKLKRKPFLKESAKKLIESYIQEGIIPKKGKNEFEQIQVKDLENVLKELYTAQPKIFSHLTSEQKKTVVGLLNLILNTEEREHVVDVVEQFVNLESSEREDLRNILKVTSLTRIIKTINLIKSRYEILELLNKVLFEPNFGATEVNHVQKIVESHTWLFGEQYTLVATAEDNFEKVLRNYHHVLTENDEEIKLEHPDKLKQMDIFICRQNKNHKTVHNIIIELKHPKVRLGEGQLSQVKKYMRIITEIDQLKSDRYTWEFILIGNDYDSTGYIENELESNKSKGEPGLVQKVKNYSIYVNRWCDVLVDCDLRHKFLNDKLELEKEKTVENLKSPAEAVKLAKESAASS
jgi:Trp operon repressor